MTAVINEIDETIDDFLEGKPFRAPEPFEPLQEGIKRFQQRYLEAKRMGDPVENRMKLLQWIKLAKRLLDGPPLAPASNPGAMIPAPDALPAAAGPPMATGVPAMAPTLPGAPPMPAGPLTPPPM